MGRDSRNRGAGMRAAALLCALLALALAACGEAGFARHAQATLAPTITPLPAVENDARASAYLNQLAADGKLRGAVLLARGDTALISNGYGPADEDSQAPNTPHTR